MFYRGELTNCNLKEDKLTLKSVCNHIRIKWDEKFDIDDRMDEEKYDFYEITESGDKQIPIDSDEKLKELSKKDGIITLKLQFEKEKDDFEKQKKS